LLSGRHSDSKTVHSMVNSRNIVIVHDLTMVAIAWCAALLARFNFSLPPHEFLVSGLKALPVVVFVQALLLWRFGLYRGLWRFASLRDLWNIIRSVGFGGLLVTLTLVLFNRLEGIPRAILILYPVFLLLLLGGARLCYRLWKDRAISLRQMTGATRVVIVGAGESGETLLRDFLRDSTYLPIGLVDDRIELARRRIHGVPVLGTIEQLPALVERYQIELIVIAIPSAKNLDMQRIVEICERSGCAFRTLPRLQDIVSGKLGLREMRAVAIDDLLGRSVVKLDWPLMQKSLGGKTILITGGGGSIGAELCRQVARLGVSQLILFEQSEFNLYEIDRELRIAHPHLRLISCMGDICDRAAVEHVFKVHKPQVLLHAAAYKHVPLVENQVREGVRNNVLGTYVVATAAVAAGCDTVVLISTDKAVRPTSVMGATKRAAEVVCGAFHQRTGTRFITVRFGNVLGSAGSVVPLFQQQISRGGPVTVTHGDATRYFMTIPEASQLILLASAVGQGGEIFVLEMGEPVNIKYLAEQMIRLSGHEPGRDIRIVFTGLRPGEKLQEELFHTEEKLGATPYEKLRLAEHRQVDAEQVRATIQRIVEACEIFDEPQITLLLRELVPEFAPFAGTESAPAIIVPFKRGMS
jgi:FlaA1/EpsC-like NDP-sugar epimerase